MTMLFTQTHAKGQVTLLASDTSLLIESNGDRIAQLAGLPDHVATHTAAAFNRAMQAVPDPDSIDEGWTYQGKSGVWHIRCPMPRVYLAQHDEITGDNDPAWMFAEAASLIDLMDLIDDIEAEEVEDAA